MAGFRGVMAGFTDKVTCFAQSLSPAQQPGFTGSFGAMLRHKKSSRQMTGAFFVDIWTGITQPRRFGLAFSTSARRRMREAAVRCNSLYSAWLA